MVGNLIEGVHLPVASELTVVDVQKSQLEAFGTSQSRRDTTVQTTANHAHCLGHTDVLDST